MGIVLAAGAGTRFGGPKALAHGGAWLRGAVVALTDGGCRDVVVVLGAGADRAVVPLDARPVVAPDWADGMSASLRAGLRAAEQVRAEQVGNGQEPTDRAVLHLVDTPDVGADVVARVLSCGADLARAAYGGTGGHPVVLHRRFWGPVAAAARGDHGARGFLRARTDVVAVECSDLATGRDIDFPPRPGK